MEDMVVLYLFKIKELILQYTKTITLLPTRQWAGFLAYGIPLILFHVAARFKRAPTERTQTQNTAFELVWGYYFLVSCLIVPSTIFTIIDCAAVFWLRNDIMMLSASIGTLAYLIVMYKMLFMIICFKKNALLITNFFLLTLPFSFAFYEYTLFPFNGLLENGTLPFKNKPSYIAHFIIGCFFAVPYLLFFTFSKRIKAAWADTDNAEHTARLGTDGQRG